MKIQLNGDHTEIPEKTTVNHLLDQLCLTGKRLAVEVNQSIIPRGQYNSLILKENDSVEIVHAIGGG